jgi:AraC-like DNA-binding protein
MAIHSHADWSHIWSVPAANGIELLHATSVKHCYPRHWHDTYVIEVVEEGINGFYCSRGTFAANAHEMMIFHPGEVHTGYPLGSQPLVYRSIYPGPELLTEIADETEIGSTPMPEFATPVIRDSLLAQKILSVHKILENERDRLQTESLLLSLFVRLLMRHAEKNSTRRRSCKKISRIAVRPAIEYLNENFRTILSLQNLADLCKMSRFHFLRVFRETVGLPPFEYVTNLRVGHARKMLANGKAIIESAHESGFYDQSHLNRHFKRIVGATPGQYRAILAI